MPAKNAKKPAAKKVVAKPAMKNTPGMKKTPMMTGGTPLGVKIISIYHYIIAALLAVFAILLLTGLSGVGVYEMMGSAFMDSGLAESMAITLAIVYIVFAVLYFFVARGLWKLKKWAKIVAIVLAALGIVTGLNMTATAIITLIINVAIIVYLLFINEAKQAFSGM